MAELTNAREYILCFNLDYAIGFTKIVKVFEIS